MDWSLYNIDAYIANHLANAESKHPALRETYGEDFCAFLSRLDIESVIKFEILPVVETSEKNRDFLNQDHWSNKHPFNFPGLFFTGESDTCGTGDSQAPLNVLYDSQHHEFIFKQPKTYAELLCIIDAAAVEVFESYSCTGNKHWTIDLCREWWQNKSDLIVQLNDPGVQKINGGRVHLYIDYLNSDAETDLRRYCYFLDNNSYPTKNKKVLPDL